MEHNEFYSIKRKGTKWEYKVKLLTKSFIKLKHLLCNMTWYGEKFQIPWKPVQQTHRHWIEKMALRSPQVSHQTTESDLSMEKLLQHHQLVSWAVNKPIKIYEKGQTINIGYLCHIKQIKMHLARLKKGGRHRAKNASK